MHKFLRTNFKIYNQKTFLGQKIVSKKFKNKFQKKSIFPDFSIEIPETLRVDPHFATSVLGNGERFSILLKDSVPHFQGDKHVNKTNKKLTQTPLP